MDKLLVILFVAIGVLALVLGCVLLNGLMNDMEKWEENDIATDSSAQVYSTAEALEANVPGSGYSLFLTGAEI